MSIGPTIETERLILRPPAAEDVEAWTAFHADPDVTRFIGGPLPPALAWRVICTMAGSWTINGFAMFSVLEKTSGRWVGRVGPWRPAGWPGTEVAWGLAREAWGKGYAVESATAAIDWAFDHLGWDEVVHAIEPENARSQAVARRLGARVLRTATLPEPFNVDVELWGQSREEWRERRRALADRSAAQG